MKNVPKIRFKGFTDAWEQRKLSQISQRVQGNDGILNLPILTISASSGWMKQKDRFSSEIAGKELKNYTKLSFGQLSYNHGNSKLAKYGVVFALEKYKKALVPRVYHSFKIVDGVPKFIEYLFATKKTDKELVKFISSGARLDGLLNIRYEDFVSINIIIPSLKEQHFISLFLKQIDLLITLHQRKCEQLKTLKKFLLQKMFPENGNEKPELRFTGFTDAWEQRKYGEIAEYKKGPFGSAITKEMFVTKSINSVKVYEQQNAIKKDWTLERYFLPKEYSLNKLKSFEVKAGDIIVSCAGTIGEIYELPQEAESGVINQALMRVRVKEKYIEKKIFIILFSNMIDKFAKIHSNGSAIKNIPPFSDLKPMPLLLPSPGEQFYISKIFTTIVSLITLHQRM